MLVLKAIGFRERPTINILYTSIPDLLQQKSAVIRYFEVLLQMHLSSLNVNNFLGSS